MSKDEKITISVHTYNWGPCVVKVKIQDDFKKALIDEAKKNELDFRDKLAGQIRNCLLYTSPSPRDGLLSRMPSSA